MEVLTRIKITTVLLIAFFLCGLTTCAPSTRHVEVDPTFTDFQTNQIAGAVEDWNRFATWKVFDAHSGWRAESSDDWLILPGPMPYNFGGYTDNKRHVIRINENEADEGFRSVILHELGHSVGMRHTCISNNPNAVGSEADGAFPCVKGKSLGVMDPDTPSATFTDVDSKECFRDGPCG